MKALALLLLSACAFAQTSDPVWVKVAVEDPNTIATLPAGTTYRLGSGTCWSSSVTVAADSKLSVYYPSGSFPFADPCPNVAKELDVQQTATAQTVTVNGRAVNVPALPTASKPAPAATVTAVFTCRVQIFSDGTFTADNCTAVKP